MKNIAKIDISKINRYGKYVDFENTEIFTLTPEEVVALRRYHNNPNIAADYKFYAPMEEKKASAKTKRVSKDEHLPQRPTPNKHYAIAADCNKYNKNYHTKKNPKIKYGYTLIIGSLVIILSTGYIWNLTTDAANRKNHNSSTSIEEEFDNSKSEVIPIFETSDNELMSETPVTTEAPVDIFSNQRGIINKYCNIYHINSDVAFDTIAKLTDNFSSEDYLANYHISGVTCKGEEIYASSEEELLLYTIRCLKQLPEQLNVSSDNLYNNNGYQSSTDYCHQIDNISKVMGVDRTLLYAICKTESDFKSELFINDHNPAGLRMDGSWWHFDTAEEGFIETCAEIIKYYRMVGKPLTDTSYNTIAEIGAIHAPVSDGNELWLDTVWEIYNEAKANEIELFGNTENNKFSK